MGVVFLVVVGGTLGWLTAILMQSDDPPGMLRNSAVGIAGALLSGLGLSPLLGQDSLLRGSYGVDAMLVSLIGSAILLLAVNFPRLRARREHGPLGTPTIYHGGDRHRHHEGKVL